MMLLPNPADGGFRRLGAAPGLGDDDNNLGYATYATADGSHFLLSEAGPDALPHLAAATLDTSACNSSKLADLVPGSMYKHTVTGQARPQPLQPPVGMGPVVSTKKHLALAGGDPNRTLPRTIAGVSLSGDEIDVIFDLCAIGSVDVGRIPTDIL